MAENHKIAIITQKNCQKLPKNGKNKNKTLKLYCNMTPIVDDNLISIRYTWYLSLNGPKVAKKWQNMAKND